MSYVTNFYGTFRPNFLESEVGLVTKTHEIPESMGKADGIYKTVPAGTPYPSNDGNAIGIVFEDVDVTYGAKAGSIMVGGRVLEDRLTVASAAKTALVAAGIKFIDGPDASRGYTVTYSADDGEGTPPIDSKSYADGDTVSVSTSYPLTKTGYTQTGWSKTSGGTAVTSFTISADTTLYPVWKANS